MLPGLDLKYSIDVVTVEKMKRDIEAPCMVYHIPVVTVYYVKGCCIVSVKIA